MLTGSKNEKLAARLYQNTYFLKRFGNLLLFLRYLLADDESILRKACLGIIG